METTIMENQMEKKMENEMETEIIVVSIFFSIIPIYTLYNPYIALINALLGLRVLG